MNCTKRQQVRLKALKPHPTTAQVAEMDSPNLALKQSIA
jgi:hypothetical protein